jgi:hypothetical protein
MNIQMITLGQRVKIDLPEGCTLIDPSQPKLDPNTSTIKIAVVVVHEQDEGWLSFETMLARTAQAGQVPINAIQDLETILTKGLDIEHHYLATGIRLHSPDGEEGILLISLFVEDQWEAKFGPQKNGFIEDIQVICYAN